MHSFKALPALHEPLQQYLKTLQRKRLAPQSLRNYQSDLELFVAFIADYRLAQWSDLSRVQAQAFFQDGLNKQKSVASCRRQLSSIRGFLQFLYQHNIISFDPLIDFSLPSAAVRPQALASAAECRRLLSFSVDSFISARDKALLFLLLETPILLVDLTALDVFCIDYNRQKVNAYSQDGSLKSHLLSTACLKAINQWLDYRQQIHSIDQQLFISLKGTSLSIRAVQLRLRYWCEQTGVCGYTLSQLRAASLKTPQPQLLTDQSTQGARKQSPARRHKQLLTALTKAHPRVNKDD